MKEYYIIITSLFPTNKSFRGPFILDQVKAIKKKGNLQVVVFKPKKWYEKEGDYEFDGIKVYRFNIYNLPSYILPGFFSKLSVLSLFTNFKRLGIGLDTIKYAHTHGTSDGYLVNAIKLKNPKVKTILQHHGFDVLNLTLGIFSKFNWYNKYIERYGVKICNKIDLHVAVSKKTLEYLKSYKKIVIKKEYVLYNGVDLTKFYKIRKIQEKNKDSFIIGCIANFWPLKDQITLIKAVEKNVLNGVKNIKVVFIGTGETLEMCKKYVVLNKLERFIEFKNEIMHHKLINFYNTLDIFVLPSYHEAFGCVYAEAYVCGVPFIGVQEQGISELIPLDERNNWLIEKSNVKQLAKLILEYQIKRPTQSLSIDLNIDNLINEFLCSI